MARDVRSRLLLASALLVAASQAGPWAGLLPLLPSRSGATRTPSSDVLLSALPLSDAGTELARVAAGLPQGAGVVVAHGTSDALASAYMVISMRLWPRPVSFVACLPTPRLEQFRVPHAAPIAAWRIDLLPGGHSPLRVAATATMDPAALCAVPAPPS
jgi:hypothetical protein